MVKKINNKIKAIYPLSQQQMGLVFEGLKDPNLYTVHTVVNLNNDTSTDTVVRMINQISQESENLHSRIVINKVEQPVLVVLNNYKPFIQETSDREIELEAILKEVIPVDAKNPIKFYLWKSNAVTKLVLNYSHVFLDGWSENLILHYLDESVSEDTTSFDITNSHDSETALSELSDKNYWQALLKDTEIPYFGTAENQLIQKQINFTVDAQYFNKVKHAFTVSSYVKYGWGQMLNTLFETSSIRFGEVISGRNIKNQNTLGMFIKTVPVKVEQNQYSIASGIESINQQIDKETAYQGLENMNINTIVASQLTETFLTMSKKETFEKTNYDLTLKYAVDDNQFNFSLLVNSHRLIEDDIERIINTFKLIFSKLIETDVEKAQFSSLISIRSNVQKPKKHHFSNVIDRFKAIVKKEQDNVAVEDDFKSISYNELDKLSDHFCKVLTGVYGNNNFLIPIILNKRVELIVSMIGVLKAGAAFTCVPIDFPTIRTEQIISDCRSSVAINSSVYEDLMRRDSIRTSEPKIITAKSPCYAIYTSGTTGRPKGTILSHQSLLNTIDGVQHMMHLTNDDKFVHASTTSVGFDVFVGEVFLSLLTGCRLRLFVNDNNFLENAIRYKVGFISITPSKLQYLIGNIEKLKQLSSLKYVLFGGEVLPKSFAKEVMQYTNAEIFNGYGPSECCIYSTLFHVTHENIQKHKTIPIGYPLPNVGVSIIRDSREVASEIPGELVISGPGVGLGYIVDSQVKQFKDFPNYHTGDIVTQSDSGLLTFKKRKDSQVKVNGQRIELKEIERVVSKQDYVSNAAAKVVTENNTQFIILYYGTTTGKSILKLRDLLRSILPKYMVPNFFILLENLPLNSHGKVDYKALSTDMNYVRDNQDMERSVSTASLEDWTKKQLILGKLFEEVLSFDNFSLDDSFFDIGGQSILAMKLVNKINQKFSIDLTIVELIENATIRELSEIITPQKKQSETVVLKKSYEMSQNQKDIFLAQDPLKKTQYNISLLLTIPEIVDSNKLNNAFEKIIIDNPVLNSRYLRYPDGRFMVEFNNHIIKSKLFFHASPIESNEYSSLIRPMHIEDGEVIQGDFWYDDHKTFVCLNIHHIVSDIRSQEIIVNQFLDTVYGIESNETHGNYYEYVEKLRNEQTSDKKMTPTKVPEQAIYDGVAATGVYESNLLGQEILKLSHYCNIHNVSLNHVLYTGLNVILSAYSNSTEVVIGVPRLDRIESSFYDTVGNFTRMTLQKLDITAEQSFDVCVAQAASNFSNIYTTPQVFAKPNIVYTFNELSNDSQTSNREVKQQYLPNNQSKFDLDFELYHSKDSVQIVIEFDKKKYSNQFISLMVQRFNQLIKNVVDTDKGQKKISELAQISINDSIEIGDLTINTIPNDFADELVNRLKNSNKATAIRFKGERITYSELGSLVVKAQKTLLASNQKIVGIMAEREINTIAVILACLLSNVTYVLLDPKFPEERLELIVKATGISRVYYTHKKWALVKELINIDDVETGTMERIHSNGNNDGTAYILFTSGTTGTPKGVEISRNALFNFLSAQNPYIKEMVKCKEIICINKLTFDITIQEILAPIYYGLTINFSSDELTFPNHLDSNTGMVITPTKMRKMMQAHGTQFLENITFCMLGAEVLDGALIKTMTLVNPELTVMNGYGPTECTCGVCYYKVEHNFTGPVPIGSEFVPNNKFILKNRLGCNGVDIPGSLVLEGNSVADGYINADNHDFSEQAGLRSFDTNDLVVIRSNRTLEYLGRLDKQIKVDGYRVEPQEVDAVIKTVPDVLDVVTEYLNNVLISFVVTQEKVTKNSKVKIRSALNEKLPLYLQPKSIIFIDSLPMNSAGKLDRKELENKLQEVSTDNTVLVNNPELRKLVQNILKTQVEDTDNLFFKGLDSLTTIKLLAAIHSSFNVRIDIVELFDHATIANLNTMIVSKTQESEIYTTTKYVSDFQNGKSVRTTAAEQRMFVLQMSHPENIDYNIPEILELDGEINFERLSNSFQKLIKNHSVLQSVFSLDGGRLWQSQGYCSIDFNKIKAPEKIDSLVKPFSLTDEFPIRGRVWSKNNKSYIFIDVHHIVADSVTVTGILNELINGYLYEPSTKLDSEFFNFVELEEQRDLTDDGKYWKTIITDVETKIDSPDVMLNRSTRNKELISLKLDPSLHIDQQLANYGYTANNYFLSMIGMLLNRYSETRKFLVGVPVSNRTTSALMDGFGLFVNTIPFKFDFEKNETIEEIMNKTNTQMFKSLKHQLYPFDKMLSSKDYKRSFDDNPLFNVFVSYEERNDEFPKIVKRLAVNTQKSVKFDLSVDTVKKDGNYFITFEYDTSKYSELTIRRWMLQLKNIVTEISENPKLSMREINSKIECQDQSSVLNELNYQNDDKGSDVDFLDGFLNAVSKYPNRTACQDANNSYTYAELKQKSDNLSNMLKQLKVVEGDSIGVDMEPSIDLMATVIAIYQSGCIYVPLSSKNPRNRYSAMCAKARVSLIIKRDKSQFVFDRIEAAFSRIDQTSRREFAYCIFTSGSTGSPKAVFVSRKTLSSLIGSCIERFSISEDDVILQKTPLIFGVSISELFILPTVGGKVYFGNKDLYMNVHEIEEVILKNKISIVNFVPTLFEMWNKSLTYDVKKVSHHLRVVLLAGEDLASLKEPGFNNFFDNCDIYNVYGSTETGVFLTAKLVSEPSQNIGKLLPYSNAFLMTNECRLCGHFEVGNIYSAVENANFTYDLLKRSSAKFFNTGDRAFVDQNGDIIFCGRSDRQIEIGGCRIELDEVEKYVNSLDRVREAIVQLDSSKFKHMKVICVVEKGFDLKESIGVLKEKLPTYMVPTEWKFVNEMHTLISGKKKR